jgi:hypothetical protein
MACNTFDYCFFFWTLSVVQYSKKNRDISKSESASPGGGAGDTYSVGSIGNS